MTVFYVDEKGKERKQLYTLVASGAAGAPRSPAVAALPAPAAPACASSGCTGGQLAFGSAGCALCTFSAAPGAEDLFKWRRSGATSLRRPRARTSLLDGKYVGSTPSAIELNGGTHAVVFSMNGFAQWKRDLTVLPGAELTVNGVLQKARIAAIVGGSFGKAIGATVAKPL
jgi:hypothetical protein